MDRFNFTLSIPFSKQVVLVINICCNSSQIKTVMYALLVLVDTQVPSFIKLKYL